MKKEKDVKEGGGGGEKRGETFQTFIQRAWSKSPLKERVISSGNRQKEWGADLRRSIGMAVLSKLNWEVGDEAFVFREFGYMLKKLKRRMKMKSLGRRRYRYLLNSVLKFVFRKMKELTVEYIKVQSSDLHIIAAWGRAFKLKINPIYPPTPYLLINLGVS